MSKIIDEDIAAMHKTISTLCTSANSHIDHKEALLERVIDLVNQTRDKAQAIKNIL